MEITGAEITQKVHEAFKSKGLKLSVVESCTGGLIGHMLTELPGASAFLHSSMVCYSASAKHGLLGIKNSFLKKHGAISEDTAREMADRARAKTGADVSLAVAGVAGPGPVEGKEAGLVYIAVSTGAETSSRGFKFDGTRGEIKHAASTMALKFLYEAVSVWGA